MTQLPSIKSFVTAEPIFLNDGTPIEGFVANRTEDGRQVGVVRDSYTIIQMEDILKDIDAAIERLDIDVSDIQTKDIVSRNGAYVAREYKFPTTEGIEYRRNRESAKVGTQLAMFFRVSTSYDSSTPTRIRSGSLDLVCTNGMVSEKDVEAFAKRHTQSVTIDRVRMSLGGMLDNFHTQVDSLRRYATIALPSEDVLIEKLSAMPSMTSKLQSRILDRIAHETDSRGDNVYALLSAMTFYSSHDSDDFPINLHGDGSQRDNIPELLNKREENVRQWVKSKPFLELVAA